MKLAIAVAQVVVAVAVATLILMQPKGTGMGRSFGSTSYHSRRGVENLVFRSTIVLAITFVLLSIVNQLVF